MWKVDRLARKVLDFLHADEALQARGAGLVAVEDPVDMTIRTCLRTSRRPQPRHRCASAWAPIAQSARWPVPRSRRRRRQQAEGRNVKDRIDALADAGHIRPHTKEQAHEIRYFGNDMAHGDFAEPISQEEAEEIMELLGKVLNEVYQSPARLARVKEAREAKKAAG